MISNFLFHRVNPVREALWDPMDVKLFDQCVRYISRNYETVLAEDLLPAKPDPKRKYATIMFDDGYKDNIEYAAPVLSKYNCKASFYVVTDCIDQNIPTWTYLLENSFLHTSKTQINLDFDFLPQELRIQSLATRQERLNYVKKLKPFLKKLSHENRELVLQRIFQTFDDVEIPAIMMNWREVQELKSAGHYIGSHTKTHGMLGTMTDEAAIRSELEVSARVIETRLGHFPSTISYPVGSFNDVTKRIAREVGYTTGLAVKQNIHDPSREDAYEISRIELYNEPWWKTWLRITNRFETIKKLAGKK